MHDHTTTPSEPLVTEAATGEHPLVGEPPRRFADQPVVETTSGLRIPALGLGTWQLDEPDAGRMVRDALHLGYRHLDTAQMYDGPLALGSRRCPGVPDPASDRTTPRRQRCADRTRLAAAARGVCAIPRTSDSRHLELNWAARALDLGTDDLDSIHTLDEGRRLVDPDRAPW